MNAHNDFTIKMRSSNALLSFLFRCRQKGGGKKNMHGYLVIAEHVWNSLHTNFHLPKLLLRTWYILAGEIPTSVATAMHEIILLLLI
jgi:hypothetical protein